LGNWTPDRAATQKRGGRRSERRSISLDARPFWSGREPKSLARRAFRFAVGAKSVATPALEAGARVNPVGTPGNLVGTPTFLPCAQGFFAGGRNLLVGAPSSDLCAQALDPCAQGSEPCDRGVRGRVRQ